ncbi:MAG: putative manganese-dependent inorganic diphosphatase [Dictyoglomi bacterium]|nr:putative manganese-dependent inorganic diphosphatase [Dictyoglomota bacterium]
MAEILVSGHRNPDTDSVTSAISYAWYKNKIDGCNNKYIPVRAGAVNDETVYVLKRFGVDKPIRMDSFELTAMDIILDVPTVRYDDPIKVAVDLIKDYRTLPVVDMSGKLVGLVGLRDVSQGFLWHAASKLVHIEVAPAQVESALPGRWLVEPESIIRGVLTVGAMSAEKVDMELRDDAILVTGDRPEVWEVGLRRRLPAIIITGAPEIPAEFIDRAKESGVGLYVTPLNTFSAVRMLMFAPPIATVMTKEVRYFSPDDTISQMRQIMRKDSHRFFPVLRSDGVYIGMVDATTVASPPRRKVILVDHNEKSQAPYGIDEVDILEIVDHHRLGDIQTPFPPKVIIEPVGCTATVIYALMERDGIVPPKEIAGIMLSAILSDTVGLTSPTTTDRDRETVKKLAMWAGEDPTDLFRGMLSARVEGILDDPSKLTLDYKVYRLGDSVVGVAQVEIPDASGFVDRLKDEIWHALENKMEEDGLTLAIFMLTDVTKRGSYIFARGDIHFVEMALNVKLQGGMAWVDGLISRKKQLIPALSRVLM